MKNAMWLVLVLCFAGAEIYAKPSSSSKPSGGSSRPSSSFKPSGSSSKPSSPKPSPSFSSPKPSPSGSSRPQSSFGNSSKPSSPSVKPSTPSFGDSSKPTVPKSVGSSRPKESTSSPNSAPITSSSKPKTTTFDSAASTAKKKEESKIVYKAATAPKETYTTSTGKAAKIDPKATSVNEIRNTVTPEKYTNRSTRVEHHYHNHYGDRYGYYRSQPYIDIGGGYNYLFWYAMMDWNAQRRAEWLYHNQNKINSDLYQQQLQNADLRHEIEKLKAQNVAVNENYVDSEFKENPDLMYSDEYVNAVYNPTPVNPAPLVRPTPIAQSSGWGWTIFLSLAGLSVVVLGGYYLVFVHQFKG